MLCSGRAEAGGRISWAMHRVIRQVGRQGLTSESSWTSGKASIARSVDSEMTLDDFFGEEQVARSLFDALAKEIARLGRATIRVSKSQVAFRRKRNFAVVWMPSRYLEKPDAPLVLTLSFERKDNSPRWKEIAQVSPRKFTHHLELRRVKDIDSQVKGWLHAAWEAAA